MSLSLKKSNNPVALVNNKIVYLHDDVQGGEVIPRGQKESNFHKSIYGKVQVLPNTDQRSVIAIFGQSGCGKSHWVNQFMKQYHKVYPKNNIFFIGPFADDPSINMKHVEYINYQLFDEEHESVFPSDLFEDSLVVFDDCSSITSKIKKYVYEVIDRLLTTGRHFNTSICVTSHQLMTADKDSSKLIKNESNGVVLYPKTNWYQSEKYLTSYLGMTKKQALDIKNLKTRWVYIKKCYPAILITENQVSVI